MFNDLYYDIMKGTPYSIFLKELIQSGFSPIGISLLFNEEVFIFKDIKETKRATIKFPSCGLWYDIESWNITRNEYVRIVYGNDENSAPKVYWLDK